MIRKDQIRTLWDEKMNEIFQDTEQEDMDSFLQILSMVIYEKGNPLVSRLYKTVDLDTFTRIINEFSGTTITIPKRHDFREAIITALSFYYKNIKHMDWKEIKQSLDFDDFAPLRTGRKLAKLDKIIKENILKMLEEEKTEEEGL